jgi:hypothetical protein
MLGGVAELEKIFVLSHPFINIGKCARSKIETKLLDEQEEIINSAEVTQKETGIQRCMCISMMEMRAHA